MKKRMDNDNITIDIATLKKNDFFAWEDFWRSLRSKVYAIARCNALKFKLHIEDDDIDAIFVEACFALHERLKKGDEIKNPTGFFLKIVRNKMITFLNKEYDRNIRCDSMNAAEENERGVSEYEYSKKLFQHSDIEYLIDMDVMDKDKYERAFFDCMKKLLPRERDCLNLLFNYEFTVMDIAATLETSTGNVSARLTEGREKLKTCMSKKNFDFNPKFFELIKTLKMRDE